MQKVIFLFLHLRYFRNTNIVRLGVKDGLVIWKNRFKWLFRYFVSISKAVSYYSYLSFNIVMKYK